MDRLADVAQLDGWIPVRFYWNDGVPAIDWCYLGRRGFSASSFAQTVEACFRYPANLLFRHQTSIEVLRQLSETRPGLQPRGFIFHLSRSAATWISRTLAALPKNIVISEARPVDSVLRAHLHDETITDVERIGWLRWLLSALGQQRLGAEQFLWVVFDSWNVLELPLIRRAFPEVPWVFIYRDPVEMLVSQLQQRGAETVPGVFSPGYFGMKPDAATLMAPEEYCATVLAALCRAALEQHADGRMLINYSQPPEEVCSLISEFFGVDCAGAENSNAKVDSQITDVILKADATRKHGNTSERLQEAASRMLYPVYEQLEAARLRTLDSCATKSGGKPTFPTLS